MAYAKIVKNSPYFSRFQVKYRRRRSGKTDYRARLRLCTQDKNKYNTPKYRLVVRFTNKDITCQIVYATLAGDTVVGSAYAHELPSYGVKLGLTNYAAAYCVGLLLARRVLTKFNLADSYVGQEEANGEDFEVEEVEDGPRPFTCLLDTGLKRTSTGSKLFAALKGALDGGLAIPHGEKRFVGYSKDDKALDSATLRKYIYGGHVADYMNSMREEDGDKYEKHFARFVKEGVDPDDLEEYYKKAHAAIRAKPSLKSSGRKRPADVPKGHKWLPRKLTYEERKSNLREKLAQLMGDAE